MRDLPCTYSPSWKEVWAHCSQTWQHTQDPDVNTATQRTLQRKPCNLSGDADITWKTTWQADPSYHQPLESCFELCWITGFWYRGQNISKQENTNVRNSGLNPIARKRFNNKEQQSNHDEFSHALLCKNDNLVACWREPTSSLNPFHLIFLHIINYITHAVLFILTTYSFVTGSLHLLRPFTCLPIPPHPVQRQHRSHVLSPASPRANILHLCGAMVTTHEPAMMYCY